jgi:diguanylate cyclase (GGDEF)-like protein
VSTEQVRGHDADVVDRARLAAHRYGMPVAALLMATLFTVSWRDGFPDLVEAVGTPLLAAAFAVGATLAWTSGRPSRRFERATVAAMLVVLVGAAFDSALSGRWNVGYPYVLGYLPLAYTGAFLLLGLRWGVLASVATYAGIAAAALVAVGTGEIHLARGIPVLGASPILIGLLYALSWSLTATARAHGEAQHAAATDPLTGVWNRRSGEEALERLHGAFALLVLDLDAFKRVNDERGHAAGDAVLQRTARAIRNAVRPDDRVVRWGGDEFVVVAPGVSAEDARALGARIAMSVAAGGDAVQASIGVAVREGHEPWRTTFDRADAELYAAKRREAPAASGAVDPT